MTGRKASRYPIAAIRERVRDSVGPLLDFSVGSHPDPRPPDLDAIVEREAGSLLLSGTAAGELDALRDAAASMMARVYGVEVGRQAVLPVPGGRTAMSFLVSAATRPDDALLVTEPAYPAMGRIAAQLRPNTVAVPLDPEQGFAPALDEVPDELFPRLRFVALNYPNNPTGATVPATVVDDLAGRLADGALLFNDATYGPLTFAGPPWSLLAVAGDRHPGLRLLELHSLAKLYGVGPVPIAFLVGDPATVAELAELSEFAWSDQSSLAIRIASWCLADGAHLEATRRFYRERLETLREAVVALGFEPYPTAGGMYVLCRAPARVGSQRVETAAEAADRLLADCSIVVVPWDVGPHGYLRFSARYRPEDLEGLVALAADGPIVTS